MLKMKDKYPRVFCSENSFHAWYGQNCTIVESFLTRNSALLCLCCITTHNATVIIFTQL